MKRRLEIVGAGIAGLTAAAAFALRGWDVTVHERSDSLRAVGSGIYIWENGLKILNAIGAYDQAVAGSHWGLIRETRNAQNAVTAVHRFAQIGDGRVVAVVRQQLMDALAAAATKAGARIEFGSQAVGADERGAVQFADGSSREADMVIAADGVGSRIRDALGLLRDRRVLGDGAIRVMIPRLESERNTTGERNNAGNGIGGSNVSEGFKFIEYWSGKRRVLYTPCNDEWVYLALTSPNEDEAHKVPIDRALWTASFPHLAQLFERMGSEGHWGRFEVVRLKRWTKGRVAILGDAAYAQAPNLGQGGGCAMMGALSLAHFVTKEASLDDAFARWEASERPLYERTQSFSSFISASTYWPDVVRSAFFSIASRSEWFTAKRWRAARHTPVGL